MFKRRVGVCAFMATLFLAPWAISTCGGSDSSVSASMSSDQEMREISKHLREISASLRDIQREMKSFNNSQKFCK